MFKGSKLIAIILGIISILFIGSTAVLFLALNNERVEKTTLQDELTQIMKERKKLSREIEELKLIKGDLEIKLGGLETQAKMLTENYEKEKSQNDIVRLKLSEKEEEIKEVETKLVAVTDERSKLREMLDDERTRYSQLKERINKLVEVKDILEEKVRDIINRQGIELERIVVKAEGELEGKVLVVNREYNFIVVNIGVRDDIGLGDILTLYRDGKYVGEAKVEKIYDTMSAATITKETRSSTILVDDNVIVRSN